MSALHAFQLTGEKLNVKPAECYTDGVATNGREERNLQNTC